MARLTPDVYACPHCRAPLSRWAVWGERSPRICPSCQGRYTAGGKVTAAAFLCGAGYGFVLSMQLNAPALLQAIWVPAGFIAGCFCMVHAQPLPATAMARQTFWITLAGAGLCIGWISAASTATWLAGWLSIR